jgi:DNA primase
MNDALKKLKDSWDIVAEIRHHVALTKKGQNFVGLCPFHSEKTPSFYVSPQKKIFHCFGCGENGDVISFVMKLENISFKEVVTEKCNELKIEHDFLKSGTVQHHAMDNFRDFLSKIQTQYGAWLNQSKDAMAYCIGRGLTNQDIQTFGIGYAATATEQIRWLHQNQCGEMAEKTGLVNAEGYPLLNHRLIFSIHNSRGVIVGFSGRALDESSDAKYINSPESPIFSKKKVLYGMHLAKSVAKKKDRLIVVEGFMDAIAMQRHGFTETVAVMGTALTSFHAKEMVKYTKNIILMFDSDDAGRAAVLKSLPPLQAVAAVIHIVNLAEKDPGDFFCSNNAEAMNRQLAGSLHYMDYYIQLAKTRPDIQHPSVKSEVISKLTERLKLEKNLIIKEHYIKQMVQLFDVSSYIIDQMTREDHVQATPPVSLKTNSKYKKSEELVLYFLISNLEFRKKYLNEAADVLTWLKEPDIYHCLTNDHCVDYELIEKITHSDIKGYLLSLCVKFTEFNFSYQPKEMEDILELLKQGRWKNRISEIKHQLGSKQLNKTQEKQLFMELSELIKKIK